MYKGSAMKKWEKKTFQVNEIRQESLDAPGK
jgi:hypothetical protein